MSGIPLSREMIALPWESRQALLEQLAHLDSMRDVRKAFHDVGATWPIRLSQQQKGDLIQVIEHWGSQEPGGLTDGLPSGIFALRERPTRRPARRRPRGSPAEAST